MAIQISWFSNERTAAGDAAARSDFAVHSLPIAGRCLRARAHRTPLLRESQDAVQEAFVDCPSEGAPAVPMPSAEVRSVAGTGGVQ